MGAHFIEWEENSTRDFTGVNKNGRIFICGEGPLGVMIHDLLAFTRPLSSSFSLVVIYFTTQQIYFSLCGKKDGSFF